MKLHIFLYDIAKIKCNLSAIFNPTLDHFVLIANKPALTNLSPENRAVFRDIIELNYFNFENVDQLLSTYFAKIWQDIIILTNDESCGIICAQLREKYHLSGSSVDEMMPFVDKVLMKEKLDFGHVRRPKYISFHNAEYQRNKLLYLKQIEQHMSYPLIAKPTNSFGSIDTIKILNHNDLKNYIEQNAKPNKSFEIDEFIEGDLYHCDGLIKDKKIIIFMSCRYNLPCMNFLQGKSLGSVVLHVDDPLHNRLFTFAEYVFNSLHLPDGAFHLEVFLTNNDELVFLEVGARAPGALLIPLYEHMHNFNIEEQHFRLQMQLPYIKQLNKPKVYGAWMIYPKQQGIVKALNKPAITSQYNIDYLVKEKDNVKEVESLLDVAAALILFNRSYDSLLEDFNYLNHFKPVVYAGLDDE